MAHSQVDDEALLGEIFRIFRTYGYEGASLSRLAEATGLEKASLYHRFPGGKQEMVRAVVQSSNEWLAKNVITPLTEKGVPAEQLRSAVKHLREFYQGGRNSCLLDTLSLPVVGERLAEMLREGVLLWMEAFAAIAKRSGFSEATAHQRAEQAVGSIEGALVLSRVLHDTKPFDRVLERLPEILIKPRN